MRTSLVARSLLLVAPLALGACLFPSFTASGLDDADAVPDASTGGSGAEAGTFAGGDGTGGTAGTGVGGSGALAGAGGQAGRGGGSIGGVGGSAGNRGTAAGGGDGGASGDAGNSGAGASAGGSAGSAGAAGGTTTTEDCANGTDDDGDGDVDCFDADCGVATACEGTCAPAGTLECGRALTRRRTDAAGSTQRNGPPEYTCTANEYPGPEIAYRLAPTEGTDVYVQLYGLDADLALFLVQTDSNAQCRAASQCVEFSDAVSTPGSELLHFTAAADADYFVMVDGSAPSGFRLVAQCAAAGGCRPAKVIEAGQTVSATDAPGEPNVTQNIDKFSCHAAIHTGREAAFAFTPTASGTYRVDLTNMTANLSLYLLAAPDCDATCFSSISASVGPPSQDESLTFVATADTTYYIVTDSFTTSVANFDVSVTAL